MSATLKSQRGKGGGGIGPEETLIAGALTSSVGQLNDQDTTRVVAFDTYNQTTDAETFPTLRDPNGTFGDALPAVAESSGSLAVGVRRLTPTECERLQGLPDGWTLLDEKTPDSRRYSALGDAVTANVAEWIGGRFVT